MKDWGHSSRLQCLPGGSDKSEADTTRTRSTKGKDSSLGHIIIRSSTVVAAVVKFTSTTRLSRRIKTNQSNAVVEAGGAGYKLFLYGVCTVSQFCKFSFTVCTVCVQACSSFRLDGALGKDRAVTETGCTPDEQPKESSQTA